MGANIFTDIDAVHLLHLMMDNFNQYRFFFGILTLFLGLAIGFIFFYPVTQKIVLKDVSEEFLSDLIPMLKMDELGEFIINKDDTFTSVIQLKGLNPSLVGRNERSSFLSARMDWLRDIGAGHISVKAISKRRFVAPMASGTFAPIDLKEFKAPTIGERIIEKWSSQFSNLYINEHYLVLSTEKGGEIHRDILASIVRSAMIKFRPYNPKILNLSSSPSIHSFWMDMINPGYKTADPFYIDENVEDHTNPRENLDKALTRGPVIFDRKSGYILFSKGAGQYKYGVFLGIPTLNAASSENLIPNILSVDSEVTILQRFCALTPTAATNYIDLMKVQTTASEEIADDKAGHFREVRKRISPENPDSNDSLCPYEIAILVLDDDIQRLASNVGILESKLADLKINAVWEIDLSPILYFAQFPTYDASINRKNKGLIRNIELLGSNVAQYISFTSPPSGFRKSDWSENPVMVFKTNLGTPYNFNFHVDEKPAALGHSLVFGRSGSGKTVLLNMLATSALATVPNLKVFCFDSKEGMKTWTSFMGGNYYNIGDDNSPVTLNPFALDLSLSRNQQFLYEFLEILYGEKPEPIENEKGNIKEDPSKALQKIIKMAMSSQGKINSISNLVNVTIREKEYPVTYSRLRKWIAGGAYQSIFNNSRGLKENFNMADKRLNVFDMTHCNENGDISSAVISYLMHCIENIITKEAGPGLIIIDEANYMLSNPVMRLKVLDLLNQARKKRIVVVLMFQHMGQLTSYGDSFLKALKSQTSTKIFFPDKMGDDAVWQEWGLSILERDFLKKGGRIGATTRLRWPFLVKKEANNEEESAFLEGDNAALGDYANFFRSDSIYVREATKHLETNLDIVRAAESFLDVVTSEDNWSKN